MGKPWEKMDAVDILRAARKRIESPEQWGQGVRRRNRPFETCCASEAIEDLPLGYTGERRRAFRALMNAAGLDSAIHIVRWNDEPGRTHAEVLAAFDLAIAALKL